jgi:hypothetical protein
MSSPIDSNSVLDSPISDPGTPGVQVAPSFPELDPNDRDPPSHPANNGAKTERSVRRRWRQPTKQEWSQPVAREPYHDYVHQLVEAGWENLRDLDNYMSLAQGPGTTRPLVISVLDISDGSQVKHWPVISDERELRRFMKDQTRDGVKVRLYMAEYPDCPEASTIEAFGSSFKLDSRFFKLAINSPGHVFTPAQRHRAPFISICFGVLDETADSRTSAKKFNVLVYIRVSAMNVSDITSLTYLQPDEHGSGWTGTYPNMISGYSARLTICLKVSSSSTRR